MNPVTLGLLLAVAIGTGIYGRHLESEFRRIQMEYRETRSQLQAATNELRAANKQAETIKKWNQDRFESLQRRVLDLRQNAG